ncbi:hypothetical protein DPMN_059013 [Dreissena polymorpha]|uniref:Uncharacterized protein n=1 Tax=Dreissena polymorpha TaxID=45954 RepID=A0A9D4C3A7_DREPO|nr:hypothetical protein DPMN_059013 [Dreissena polymorpha]
MENFMNLQSFYFERMLIELLVHTHLSLVTAEVEITILVHAAHLGLRLLRTDLHLVCSSSFRESVVDVLGSLLAQPMRSISSVNLKYEIGVPPM